MFSHLCIIVEQKTLLSFSFFLNDFMPQVEERFGAVNWDPNVKTTYCGQCVEVSVESTGQQHWLKPCITFVILTEYSACFRVPTYLPSCDGSGGALEHQPMRLGRFAVHGALWENMVPLFMVGQRCKWSVVGTFFLTSLFVINNATREERI